MKSKKELGIEYIRYKNNELSVCYNDGSIVSYICEEKYFIGILNTGDYSIIENLKKL